ncbi:MAG: heparinase II/III family protein, partial [Rhodospirillaceae bacterium]|nr:heparinase II/III family protein [Rhodospirillaceae bacterium]
MADGAETRPRSGQRRGNQRPKLLAPRLQTLFSLPAPLIWQRLRRRLLQPVYHSGLYHALLGRRSAGELQLPASEPWGGDAQAGLLLLEGEFRFAGEVVRGPTPLGNPMGVGEGWREIVNSFAWLNDLRAVGGPSARQLARQLVMRWIEENERYDAFTWRADILAARLHNILLNHSYLEVNNDALFRSQLLLSLSRQAEHLCRALPDGLAGGAYVKAVVTLMLAGLMLPRGEKWLARGQALLGPALAAQMLADGGHVERSPQVMLGLLQHLIDLRDTFQAALTHMPAQAPRMPESLPLTINNLGSVLLMLSHGDGMLAGFNDTPELDPLELVRTIERTGDKLRPLNQLPLTGFQRLDRGRTSVIMDCGAPPRHGLDDHAHAGTLSFELTHEDERMIVNCGAHPWSKEWRQVQRTTAAHSTLIVDNTNSAMLLPHGGLALRPNVVTCRREETDGQIWLDTSHDGYEEGFGLVHRRKLYLSANGHDFMGEEHLVGPGGNEYALRFHLHPQVSVSVTQDGHAALLKMPKGSGWRLRVDGAELALAESVHIGAGGQLRRSQQIVVLGTIDSDRTEIRWLLQREGG